MIGAPGCGLVGFVQATVYEDGAANVAYELGTSYQGRGWAARATAAVLRDVSAHWGVRRAFATIGRRNLASIGLATRLGFVAVAPDRHPHDRIAAGDDLFLREPAFDASLCTGF